MKHRTMKRKVLVCSALACTLAFTLCLVGALAVQPAQAEAKAKITSVKMSSDKVKVSKVASRYYTGKAFKPSVTVKFETKKLKKNTYYKVSYSKNKAIGIAKITLKAKKKSFTYKGKTYRLKGKRVVKFAILDPVEATLSETALYFTGSAVEPAVTVKYKGKKLASSAYAVTYSDNTQVGTGTVRVQGTGSYVGLIDKTLTFKIVQADTSYSLNKFSGVAASDVATANVTMDKELDTVNRIADLSIWDKTIDWSKAHSKIDVAFLRSYVTYQAHKNYGDGAKMIADENYDSYATSCEEYDLPYAAYGYLIFTNATDTLSDAKKDAKVQAKKFWNASFSNGHAPLYLILDIEDANMSAANPTRVVQCTKAAINRIQKLALKNGYGNGIKIGLYVGNHVYKTFGFTTAAGQKVLDEQVDFIWIPTYGKNTGSIPTKYFPSYACDLWQYTSAGSISGITTDVDLSIVNTAGPNAHDITWYKER